MPFEVFSKEFEDRDDVIEWIIKNQFGRRNLSDYQRGVLALRLKPIIEARAKEKQKLSEGRGIKGSPNSDDLKSIRTDEVVADMANISRDTIRKIEQIKDNAALAVKALAASGEVSINLAAQFALLPEKVQQEALSVIAAQHKPAKEIMREAVHNHRAKDAYEATGATVELLNLSPVDPLVSCLVLHG